MHTTSLLEMLKLKFYYVRIYTKFINTSVLLILCHFISVTESD